MANGLEATFVGNLTRDPELTFTRSGKPVVKIGIAVNRVTGRDDARTEKVIYVNAEAWDKFAENITESLGKGMRVIASGHFEEDTYKDRDGNDRKALVFKLDAIGPDLRFASANVSKNPMNGNGGRSYSSASVAEAAPAAVAPAAGGEDPWF